MSGDLGIRFKEKHSIGDNTNFLQLFIDHEEELYDIAKKSYFGLFEEPKPADEFEAKLLQYFKNRVRKESSPKTGYYHLGYSWEPHALYKIPGYLTTKKEIEANYLEIVARNLYLDWFSKNEKGETKVHKKLDFVNQVGRESVAYKVEGFYDNPKNLDKERWDQLKDILRAYSKDPRYLLIVDSLDVYHEACGKIVDVKSFEEAYRIWTKDFGFHPNHKFPLFLWGFTSKWKYKADRKFNEKNDWLTGEAEQAFDPLLKKADFLELQLKNKLTINKTNGIRDYERYGLDYFVKHYPNYDVERFRNDIREIVAAKFKDQLYRLVQNDLIQIRALKEAGSEELAMVAAVAYKAGLFKTETQAREFMALHFLITDSPNKAPKQLKPSALSKSFDKLKKRKRGGAWRALRAKMNDHIEADN